MQFLLDFLIFLKKKQYFLWHANLETSVQLIKRHLTFIINVCLSTTAANL